MQAPKLRSLHPSWLLFAGSLLAAGTGFLVLLGWEFHLEVLTGILPGYVTMKPVIAVAFILCGFALWLFSSRPVGLYAYTRSLFWGRILAILILLLGLESLLETWLGLDWGLNQLLFHQALMATQADHPGRMSLPTAFNFELLGMAFLLIDVEWRQQIRPAEYLAVGVIVSGLLGVAGYIYGSESLYHSRPFTSMALHTAVLFIVVGAGVLLLRPDRGFISVLTSDHAGGWMARRILPITSCLPFAVGWLRTHGERAGLYNRELGFAVFAVANISTLAAIVWMNARSLNRLDAERDETEKEIQLASRNLKRINDELQAEIVRRRAAQDSLRAANESLEAKVAERTVKLVEANKELEAFSYSVSHDLRAPLRAIEGFSKLLLESTATVLDAEQTGFLQRVRAGSQRMGRLIDDLLSFSRLTRSEIRQSEVNLSRMAEQIVGDLRKSQPERKVEVSIAPGMYVQGDENLLHVVLVNLLGNAWKFTEKKDRAEIEFGQRTESGRQIFFVRDNGAGFDMRYADRLFGAFQRLHRLDEFDGNGIGLATVQRILNRHQGSIRAEAKVEEGATFFFDLPKNKREK